LHISKYRLKTEKIGDNIALGLTYTIAAEAAGIGIRYSTAGIRKTKIQNLGNILSSINLFKNVTQMPLKNILNVLIKQQKQETAWYVCGSWKGDFRTNLEDGYIKNKCCLRKFEPKRRDNHDR